ncbi:MAG: CinA family protein [Gammaproteobacteria bacterium]|nr:CinA family protein [Gammaproteobacteria bacterium]
MNSVLQDLIDNLKRCDVKMASVESCTGGMIGKILTDRAGSSSWFEGGFITYSNDSKQKLVNVKSELLESYGAVSQQVVEAMAHGGNQIFKDAIVVAVSGIAGPDGGSEEKPVGTVWIATSFKQQVKSEKFNFSGDREAVRQATVENALKMVNDCLNHQHF